MITVTERAVKELQGVLKAQSAPRGQGVKLVPNPEGGISLTIASPAEGDEVTRKGKEPLLIIDTRLTGEVDGLVFDVQTIERAGGAQKQFTLVKPGSEL